MRQNPYFSLTIYTNFGALLARRFDARLDAIFDVRLAARFGARLDASSDAW